MWVDKGHEFYYKDAHKLGELFSTENEDNSCVTERFKRTIQKQFIKYLSANNTREFVDGLGLLVYQYNNAIHSSLKITPKEASRKENENKVWKNLYPEFGGKTLTPNFRLVIMFE